MKDNYPMIRTTSHKRKVKSRGAIPCPECGKSPAITVPTLHRFRYGIGAAAVDLEVTFPVRHSQACGLDFLDRQAEVMQHEAVYRHLGLLTQCIIRQVLAYLGVSPA